MDIFGQRGFYALTRYLGFAYVKRIVTSVFGTFAGVLVSAIILTLTIYFIRKILGGANKGRARLR